VKAFFDSFNFKNYDDALIEEKVKIVRGECPRGLLFAD